LIRIIATIDAGTNRSFVAAGTARIPSVVARVVALSAVLEAGWRPAICRMADITLFSGTQMTDWFESCATTIDVTLVAVSGATGIMGPCAAYEGCRGVAEVAIQSGGNVCGVGFGIHADCCPAVMA